MIFSSKKVISYLMVSVLILEISGSGSMLVNAQDLNVEKQYIIVADDSKTYDSLIDEIGDDISEENLILSENNIMVVELSEKEADLLDKNDNLLVEEDLVINANTVDNERTLPCQLLKTEEAILSNEQEGASTEEDSIEEDSKVTSDKKALFDKLLEEKEDAGEEEYETAWNLQVINADELNLDLQNQQKVKVAVLDSGVDVVEGIDLADSINLVKEEQEITPMFLDITGHGTGIASVIAGNGENVVQGVNPNVDLYSVKVLDEKNAAPISRIIEGIYWCIENDMNIINMSFGTSVYSHALKKAVEDAYGMNILMVGAAGNNADSVEYPAAFEEVMAVAATNTQSEISSFSNTGNELEIAAPGEKIRVASFFNGNVVTHGTSIAVPHVVGVASLLWEKDLSKSNEFIRQLIDYSSKNISNTNECGLIDAKQAVALYDDFTQNFDGTKLVRADAIPQNTEEPESFEYINDDETYVEGRWGSAGHQGVVDTGAKPNGITNETTIKIIKAGAVFPDRERSGWQGGGDYPEWHGVYKYYDICKVNYVACYELVTRIALKGGDTSSFTNYKKIYGINKTVFDWIVSSIDLTWVGVSKWSTELSSYGNTAANRKYFLWGCALHILADTFAHSTRWKSGSALGAQITHAKNPANNKAMADDIEYCPNRYKVATKAVEYSLECLTINTFGDFLEITFALDDKFNNTFAKMRLFEYANSNSGGLESGWQMDVLKKASCDTLN